MNKLPNPIKMSVVVPTHGRTDLFKLTLNCLEQQTSKQFEIIVTDDSPSEEDRKIIKKAISAFSRKDITIRYVFSKPNILQAPNTNQGIRFARGGYIRILHSDDLIAPTCIEKEIKTFDENKDLDFFYHHAITFTENIDFTNKEIPLKKIDIKQCWLSRSIFLGTVLPTCLCFRKSLYKRIGGMNEKYKFLCDWQLFFDFLLDSYKNKKMTGYIDRGYVGWRIHPNSVSNKLFFLHFFEHEDFIKNITKIYKSWKILPRKSLLNNIYEATLYRYSRLNQDIKRQQFGLNSIKNLLTYLYICFSRKYMIVHLILTLLFLPINLIKMLCSILKKLFFHTSEVQQKCELKMIRLWK